MTKHLDHKDKPKQEITRKGIIWQMYVVEFANTDSGTYVPHQTNDVRNEECQGNMNEGVAIYYLNNGNAIIATIAPHGDIITT